LPNRPLSNTIEFSRSEKDARHLWLFIGGCLAASNRQDSTPKSSDLERNAWRKKGGEANGVTIKFNVPRNRSTFKMKKFFYVVLGLYPKRRIACSN
jgi:hypothetical protein